MKTIIFYSGSAGAIKGGSLPGEPEYVLKDDANIMLSYFLISEKNQDQHRRIPKIMEGRKKKKTRVPLLVRFWKKVIKRGFNECWEWTGWKDKKGYGGIFIDNGIWRGAHIVALEIEIGRELDIKGGECALHDCPGGDNPGCVNPYHLYVGTKQDNNVDALNKNQRRVGSKICSAKLDEDKVRLARELFNKGGITAYKLSRMFGVGSQTMKLAIERKTWKHVK